MAGRLGHGNDNTLFRPKEIEALAGKTISGLMTGLDHSVAVVQVGG